MSAPANPVLPVHLAGAKPCPFCGSTRIVTGERHFALCVDCGATGPERSGNATRGCYLRDWNTRIEAAAGNVPSSPTAGQKGPQ